MSLRLAAIALVAVAVTSCSALACKGPTLIFQDNFQTVDPAWYGGIAVAGGHANVTANPEQYSLAFYGGKIIDSADVCVDMVAPSNVKDPSNARAGILFGFTDVADYYVFGATEDGNAVVFGAHQGGALTPVVTRPAPSLKKGGGVTNLLRLVWKDINVSAYINDQPFITFALHYAFKNSFIGFFSENDEKAATTFQFSTLKVTNVP